MADPRAQIRAELESLGDEGELLYMSESVKTNSELRALVEQETDDQATSKAQKGSKTPSSKGKDSTASRTERGGPLAEILSEEAFGKSYQRWYSRALRVIEKLLPDRYDEFRELHRLDKRVKELDVTTYTISDYIHGTRVTRGYLGEDVFDNARVALTKLKNQVDILASANARLDSSLADIEGILEAGLLDDEVDTARELLKGKYLRAAGVVAGVVLERHLKRLISNHNVPFRKKAQIASLNDALKAAKIYDIPQWRQIQRLGDIRNLCGHSAEREPKSDEVEELISGVEKVSTTVF